MLPEVRSTYGACRNFIGGKWAPSSSERRLDIVNPATAEVIGEVPLSTKEDVNAAVDAAAYAFDSWRKVSPVERARYLFRLRGLLESHVEELSRIITQDQGKTIEEARGEMRRAIENVEVACGIPSLMMGYGLEDGAAAGIDEQVTYQPLGVFAAITPFNFPAMIASWFWPYAVAAGNTFIVKPSEQDPLVQQRIFELIDEAGFPPGVINLVNGGKDTVDAILAHPDIRGISFVGSTPVAKYVYAQAAAHGKRAQCGGGARNFLVILPDAKLDQAAENVASSVYGMAGERCLAGSVVVPLGDAGSKFLPKFERAATSLRLGYGLDPSVSLGPVVSRAHRERILSRIATGEDEGVTVPLDGRKVRVPDYHGWFVGPTIVDGATEDMKILREEIFGPVATVLREESLNEAIEAIHRIPYGNAASIYTQSGSAAREFRYRVRCGNIGVNVGVAAPMAYFPFGGMRDSFFGDLHGQGRDAVRFFTESKVVIERWR